MAGQVCSRAALVSPRSCFECCVPYRGETRAKARDYILDPKGCPKVVRSSVVRRRRLPISSRLDAVKLGVWAAPGHELVVGADLGDARAVEYDDEVGHANRAEPV